MHYRSRKSVLQAVALAGLLSALVLAACSPAPDGPSGALDSEASGSAGGNAADRADTLPLGVILPLSGPLAAYGSSTLDGIQIAVDETNASGGIDGRNLVLVVENNEGDTTKSGDALRKLEGLNKVLAVIGPITSSNALAIVRDAQRKGVILITPTGTNDTITGYGDFIFRTCFNDSFQGVAMAKFAREELGIEVALPFQDTTSDYSVGLCQSFAGRFAELGGSVAETLSYKQGDTDFTAQLRKMREMNVGAVFVPGYPPELPLFVNQARGLEIEAVLLGADGWDNNDLVKNSGGNLEGSYFSAAFSPGMSTPALEAFLDLAAKAGIEKPGTFESLGYDSVGLIAEALRGCAEDGALSGDLPAVRRALRDEFAAVEGYQGATGTITMQESGDPLKSLVVLEYTTDPDTGSVIKKFVKMVNP